MKQLFFYVNVLIAGASSFTYENVSSYTFPRNFMIGVATSAYQIEGAWNESGKGISIWDKYVHERPFIFDRSTGDIAADSYHLYKQDVAALKHLGVDFYRFSISWSRILPTGYINVVNQAGIDYYNNLINELLNNGVVPMVTMYHWDLPQPLQDLGGWTNPLMADYFEDYAYVLFSKFGDRVKWWITINEAANVCMGYNNSQIFAPGVDAPGTGFFLAAHTLIQSHAKAYRLYDKEFRTEQKGKVGIAIVGDWFKPLTDSEADRKAAENTLVFQMGLFSNPIFSSEGDYPKIIKERMQNISEAQGYRRSRLRKFTPEEIASIRGSSDFMGLNYYTGAVAKADASENNLGLFADIGVTISKDPDWPESTAHYIQIVPKGLRILLNWIKNAYNNVPVFVTENGFPDGGKLQDTDRIQYLIGHLNEILMSIHEDGCNVIGYTYWSLLDNFEWHEGYTQKFGVFHVNFSDPSRRRTPKSSAFVFSEITRKRSLPVESKKTKKTATEEL